MVEGDFHDGSNPVYCSAEHAYEDQGGGPLELTRLPDLFVPEQDSKNAK